MATVQESIVLRLQEKFGTKPELSDSLSMLGIDSVGMAELTYEIEQMYQIKVDDALLDVDTVQELIDYIEEKKKV